MKMKKALAILLAAMLLIALAGCSGSSSKNYILASGGTSGTYYPFGGAMGQLINKHVSGANVTTQATGASKENIRLIANNEADLAIVQNDVLAYAEQGIEIFEGEKVTGVTTVATLYPEIVQIVVAADSPIKSVADLKGKRVSCGRRGSGVEANAKQILAAYGLAFGDITKETFPLKTAATHSKMAA
jgi:TRAP transporter TAXI family solute receptor